MSNDLVELDHSMMWSPDERTRQLYQELARDIVSASSRDIGSRTSGSRDRPLFDPTLFVGRPTILRRLGALLALHMPKGADRIVTSSIAGVALAASASLACGLPFSVLLQGAEAAAADGFCEPWGNGLLAHESVVLIEDIVDTGRHALGAMEQIDGSGGRVRGVLAVIDLEGEGAQVLMSAAPSYNPLFRRADLWPSLVGEQ